MTTTEAPAVVAVLARADKRWASQRHEDRAPQGYLAALAAAVDSMDRGGQMEVDIDAESELADELERTKRILQQRDNDIAKLRDATGQQATEIDRLRAVIHLRDDQITTLKNTVHEKAMTAALTSRHLRRVVEAITGQPATDITEPLVDRAVQLVNAAVDQLGQRMDAGKHLHQYPVGEDGRPGPCACKKPFPEVRRVG